MTYPNAVFSVFAFAGFIMCAIPLPWHIQAWNTGTCLYMIWAGLGCLNQFVNSIVWNRNAINWAPVWCDISTRIIIGITVAIPSATLCITRRLYHIACVRVVTVTKSDKRRAILVDLAIGIGLPILSIILSYIVQGHRFDIFEDIGCYPALYYVWPLYPIFFLPPIVLWLISGTYACLTIIAFHKNRSQFNSLLSSQSNITSHRFIRLMCLAGVDVLFSLPCLIFIISINARSATLNPWISWDNVHSDFSRVDQFPSLIWRSNILGETAREASRWSIVFCAFVFFAFFGFAEETRKNYRSAYQTVAKRVGISTASFGSDVSNAGFLGSNGMKSKTVGSSGKVRPILPVFVHQEMLRRQDSLDSFTDMSMSIGDVSGVLNEKSDLEKQENFCPTLSYSGLSIADVGGTLADIKDDTVSSTLSPASSSTSSISYPTPARTRQNSDGIEVSSVCRDSSSYIESSNSLTVPTSNPSRS